MVAFRKPERWHLTHFCYFPSESKTSPRMCSYWPIFLEKTWLAASQTVQALLPEFLLASSSIGHIGKGPQRLCSWQSLRRLLLFLLAQTFRSSLKVPFCHLSLIRPSLPRWSTWPFSFLWQSKRWTCAMGKSFRVGLAKQGNQGSCFPHVLEPLQKIIGR